MADKDDDKQIQNDPNPNPETGTEDDPLIEDADDLALAEARAAVAAEEAAERGEEPDETEPEPGKEPPQEAGEDGQDKPAEPEADGGDKPGKGGEPDGKASPMIPKARFDEINSENARLREQLAYQHGVMEATKGQAAGNTPPAEAPKSPEERLAEVRQQKLELAAKYDEGEMSFAELTAETDKLVDQEDAIRAERLEPKETASQPAQSGGDDLYLEDRTQQLEENHPYARLITAKADWDFITAKSVEELQSDGVTLSNDARGDMVLRERMAKLTDRYGPALTGKDLPKSNGQTQTNEPGGLSQVAAARKEKLALAGTHPPDLSNSGSPGTATEYTDEKLGSMTMEEIAELPQSTRDRLAGR